MTVLVCYDVKTEHKEGRVRLRRLATACKDRGVRVQYSIFECAVEESEWLRLRAELLSTVEPTEDSLRFYFIDDRAIRKTEHHGVRMPLDAQAPLII